MIGPQEEEAFLRSIPSRLDEYIHSAFLAGSLDAGSYIIAIQEEMGEEQRDHFAKGLSLELLLKVRINGEKSFLIARYQYACCRPEDFKGEGSRAEKAVADLIHAYYIRVAEESPIRMLTEKCRQLMEGNSEVVFDEYTDLEMMELSKAFSRYRKQVEPVSYTHLWLAATAVGNSLLFVGGILYTTVPIWACWLVFVGATGASMIVMLSICLLYTSCRIWDNVRPSPCHTICGSSW